MKYSEGKIWTISLLLLLSGIPRPLFCSQIESKTYKVKSIRTIKRYGKSLDWSHKNNLIVSARKGKDGYYDIFVMNPDGTNERCLTHAKPGCPQKHNGNPAWHPSGDYVVFTAEKKDSPSTARAKEYAVPGTGFNCDLWLMTSDGEKFYQLTNLPMKRPATAVIHPQFSHDGRKLLWAERVEYGKSFGGGWVLKIGDLVIDSQGPHLENMRTYQPAERRCFYESHAFSNDDRKILFSGNLKPRQSPVGLDLYELDLEANRLKRLTESANDWDEHAHYSPNGTKIAWMSSTGFDIEWDDISGHNWQRYLKTELWIMDADGLNKQRLTYFNTPGHAEYMGGARCVVSDSAWSPDGKSIVALLAYETRRKRLGARIVMIELDAESGNSRVTATGTYDESIMHSGLERTYRIHIPPSFDKTRAMPLIIALHGGGGTGKKMEELTHSGFNELSDKEGFIVVYPDGVERHWNDGRKEVRYRAHRQEIDDVGFISTLIDKLVKELNVDKKRVYATGMSNGAMMSHRLACELCDKIAAIAPVTGSLPEALSDAKPSRAVSVLIINGTKDPLMPWKGGYAHLGRLKVGKVLSTHDTVKFWIANNKCQSKPTVTLKPDKDPKDGTRVSCEVYSGGKNRTEVTLYTVQDGGHTWPNGFQYLPKLIIGRTSRDINANEVIWDFFKKHSVSK